MNGIVSSLVLTGADAAHAAFSCGFHGTGQESCDALSNVAGRAINGIIGWGTASALARRPRHASFVA